MWTTIPTLASPMLLVALGAALGAAPAADEIEVHWRGHDHPVDPPPAQLPVPAAEVLARWAPWAAEAGYELHLDDDARVLFVARKPSSRALKLIGRTTAFFDQHLPAPERAAEGESGATDPSGPAGIPRGSARSGVDPIPEDPESESTGTSLSEALYGTPVWGTSWGAGSGQLDRDTIVILAVDVDDYTSVVDRLVTNTPSLAPWGESARASSGFVLESPPVGTWVNDAVLQEEWDPDGELVHRLTDLLLMRRFGRQPYWIVRGIAWTAEHELRGGIWCYPFRDEFVYTVEHGGWTHDVRNHVKQEYKDERLSIADISGLKRGSWDGQAARMAFGAMAWMMRERSEGLVKVLEDLRPAYEQGCRVDKGGGLWERDTSYEVPATVVHQAFLEHLGEGVYAELTEALKSFR